MAVSQNTSKAKGKDDSFLVPIPDRQLTCVEYPGKVVNVDRALETLGGEEKISQVSNSTNQRLPLHFRPDDIYCKPVFGNKYSTTNMLLKVSKKKKKTEGACPASPQPQMSSSSAADDDEYSCEVVGIVDSTFRFEGMCDYQFLPMRSNVDGSFRSALEELVPDTIEDLSFLEKVSHGPFMVPGSFSRSDIPANYVYQKSKEGVNPNLDEALIGKRRKKRPGSAYIVSFHVRTVPTEPPKEALDDCERLHLHEEFELLKKLFEVRPLSTRMALSVQTRIPMNTLKILLPAVAFYFLSGPWRTNWCRLGFDPRVNDSSRLYQVVDFRMRKNVLSKAKEVMRPMHLRGLYNVPTKQMRRDKKGPSVTSTIEEPTETVIPSKDRHDHTEAHYILKEGVLPAHYQICYQFCDLHVEALQKIIAEAVVKKECDPKFGWWDSELCNRLRNEMSRIVERTVVKILQENKGKEPGEEGIVEKEKEVEGEGGEDSDDEEDDLYDEMESDNEEDMELLEYLEPMDT